METTIIFPNHLKKFHTVFHGRGLMEDTIQDGGDELFTSLSTER